MPRQFIDAYQFRVMFNGFKYKIQRRDKCFFNLFWGLWCDIGKQITMHRHDVTFYDHRAVALRALEEIKEGALKELAKKGPWKRYV